MVLASASMACTLPTAPLPDGARMIDPPLIYRVWWQQTEECASRTGSFRSVNWFRVPSTHEGGFWHRGRIVTGVWMAHGNRILLSEHVLDRPLVVRHEMLHAILRTGDHPTEYFHVRCGSWIVNRG